MRIDPQTGTWSLFGRPGEGECRSVVHGKYDETAPLPIESWSALNKPYWQRYWWRLSFREDGGTQWSPMDSGPLSQVPNTALATTTLEAWVAALLAEAPDELDDLRGELLLECYETPTADTPPVYSRRVHLPGSAVHP